MPQKRTRKTPFVLAGILGLTVIVSVLSLWTVFGNVADSLAAAADISLSQIEYITVRVENDGGVSQVKKITAPEEISRIYNSLSHISVKKRVSFGTEAMPSDNSISLKLKDKNGIIRICDSGNRFAAQNSGPLSAFFVCYYDVADPNEFSQTVSNFAA